MVTMDLHSGVSARTRKSGQRSRPIRMWDGAGRLVEPVSRLFVPPVQAQCTSEIVDGLIILAEAEENAATDQVEPYRMGGGMLKFPQG